MTCRLRAPPSRGSTGSRGPRTDPPMDCRARTRAAPTAATVVPTRDGVYAATGAGIFSSRAVSWDRVWPVTLGPWSLGWVLAVSRDEVLTHIINGSWHFSGGVWAREPIGPRNERGSVSDMALAPDGTVWAASIDGVWYRRDGRWAIADAGRASTISWIAMGRSGPAARTRLRARRRSGRCGSMARNGSGALRPGARSRACRRSRSGPAGWPGWALPRTSRAGGLARFDGRSWETIREVAGVEVSKADVLGTTPGGDIWVALQAPGSPWYYARFDGTRWTAVEQPAGHLVGGPGGRRDDLDLERPRCCLLRWRALDPRVCQRAAGGPVEGVGCTGWDRVRVDLESAGRLALLRPAHVRTARTGGHAADSLEAATGADASPAVAVDYALANARPGRVCRAASSRHDRLRGMGPESLQR